MLWGVMLGFGAATCQSASYFFSRLFVIRRKEAVAQLLVLAHVVMGVWSLAMLPLLWSEEVPPLRAYLPAVVSTSGFYLLGQLGLFLVLRHVDASRVSPLLGLKVLILAGITTLAVSEPLSGLQWAAVLCTVVAAFVLNYSGGAIAPAAILGIVLTCLFYSLSDLSIQWLVGILEPVGAARAPVLATALSYVLCGAAAMAVLPWVRPQGPRDWPASLPFAGSWFLGMIFLFACFASIGVVFGNIIQSTRGLISILIGARLARAGMQHLERKVSIGVLLRRIGAAALMCLAVALFLLGGS